mgnify:CR=1 FL=1
MNSPTFETLSIDRPKNNLLPNLDAKHMGKLIYKLNRRERLQSSIDSPKLRDLSELSRSSKKHDLKVGGRNALNNYHFAKALFSPALNSVKNARY